MTFTRHIALMCAVTTIGILPAAEARPVSYPDGWTVMQRNNGDFSSFHIHWSPTFQDSIGLYSERNWGEDVHFTGLQYNRLCLLYTSPSPRDA